METTTNQIAAYETGKLVGRSVERLTEWIYSGQVTDEMVEDPSLAVFFEAGRAGKAMPVWATGWRWGALPASGVSHNFADNRDEAGVSCMAVDGVDWDPNGNTFEMFNAGRKKVILSGWTVRHARGSDGEPLLAGAAEVL
jgi:hypothetical protein